MIDSKVIKKLEQLSTFGSEYMFDEEELKANKFNFQKRLRDFESTEILKVINNKKIQNIGNLFYELEKSTSDLNTHAHIYGYESMKAMKEAVEKEKQNIHHSKDFEEKLKELDKKIEEIKRQRKD